MFLPDWVYDDVLAPADPSAIRVVLALFRHGSPTDAGDGSKRIYWRGTRTELARLTRQSRRASDIAIAQLAERGVLAVHETADKPKVLAFSCCAAKTKVDPGSNRLKRETAPIHADGDPSIPTSTIEVDENSTTTMTRDQLFSALENEGVSNPAAWLATYDHGRIESALQKLYEQYERDEAAAGQVQRYGEERPVRYTIHNPPGFLHRLLERR